jgi:hypothetical protein
MVDRRTARYVSFITEEVPMSFRPLARAVPALALVLALGCEEAQTGNEGELQFTYWASPTSEDFNQPLLVGARMTYGVRDPATRQDVDVAWAESDTPEVVTVAETDGPTVTLLAIAEGEARLRVGDTTDTRSDSLDVFARVPDVHTLAHLCTDADEAAYLTRTTAELAQHFSAGGRDLLGAHYAPVTPEGDLQVRVRPRQDRVELVVGGPGAGVVRSDLTDGSVRVRAITEGDVDALDAPVGDFDQDTTAPGQFHTYTFLPRAAGVPVCGVAPGFTVASDTPDVCDAAVAGADAARVRIDRHTTGTCTYTITLTATGLTRTTTLAE